MNIVSMAMQYLTPMIVDRIASSLGVQSPMIRTAIGAILPTILGGMAGAAAKPGGGRQLTDILGRQSPNILGDLGSIFGGQKQADVVKSGSNDLRDLLGGGAVSGLTSAVSKFAGLGEAPTQSLLGMLAPIALGAVAQEQKKSGLDAAGLVSMLAGQKDNIKQAMPEGFSKLLEGTGLLDGLAPKAMASEPPQRAAAPVREAPRETHAPATKSGGMGMWPYIAAAAALAVLGWNYFGGSKPARVALPTAPAITVGNQNIGAQLGSVAEGLRGTLVNLKDEASAKAALPRLQEMVGQLGGIQEAAAKLPADGRKSLGGYAGQLLPMLRPLIERALQAAGVGAIAKPVLDQILNRLEAIAKA